jgi:hypothetical protein
MAMFAAVAVAVACALGVAARGDRRGRALGLAGGVLYGAADAATKAVVITSAGSGGLSAALLSPWAATLVVLSAGAFVCFQRGLQLGPPVPVIALMTAATTVFGVLGGLLVFRDPLGGPVLGSLHVIAFVVVTGAGLALAAAQARLVPDGPAGHAANRRSPVTA